MEHPVLTDAHISREPNLVRVGGGFVHVWWGGPIVYRLVDTGTVYVGGLFGSRFEAPCRAGTEDVIDPQPKGFF